MTALVDGRPDPGRRLRPALGIRVNVAIVDADRRAS
jgi:hypothetical protein